MSRIVFLCGVRGFPRALPLTPLPNLNLSCGLSPRGQATTINFFKGGTSSPFPPDQGRAALTHAVITSVDRDDLPDGGASHFAQVILWIRRHSPSTTVEVLTPDFRLHPSAASLVIEARPDVFNHNLETVPRLYPTIRPGARYFTSLRLLERVKESAPDLFTKSGLMVGLGEEPEEVWQVMDDLRAAGVDFLTIGQYLRPTPRHASVARYVSPEEFEGYAKRARGKGFRLVSSSPLTRSSYHAGDHFNQLRQQALSANQ